MKVIRKIFVDYEKEEKWLNKMSLMGLEFTRYSWFKYYFKDSIPGEYIFRCELLENLPTHPESEKYIEFLNETGIEFVCSWMRWVYLKKKSSDGPFDIFSDYDSRISHYKRIMLLFGIIGVPALVIGIINITIFNSSIPNLFIGVLDILVWLLPLSIALKYFKKMKKLKKERLLWE